MSPIATTPLPFGCPERVVSIVDGSPVPVSRAGHDLTVVYPATGETISLLREAGFET